MPTTPAHPQPLSPRIWTKAAATVLRIEDLLVERFRKANRRVPVRAATMRRTALLLGTARRLLSRSALVVEVPPLAKHPPLLPGDLFVRLLRARLALQRLLVRHSSN